MKRSMLKLCFSLLHYIPLHRLLCPFFKGNGVILVLHRVVSEQNRPRIAANSRIEISPQFLEHLIDFFLGLNYEVVSLDAVHQRLTGSSTGPPFVCFTFDDGYIDAFETIYPIFNKYQLPYAVYVVTDFPDKKSVLWWYMIENLVLNNDPVQFRYAGKDYNIRTTDSVDKEAAYDMIREILISLSPEQMEAALDAIFTPYSITPQMFADQQMNWDQVVQLAHDPLVTIGAHTVHHYNLKELTPDQVRWEIQTSKEILEKRIERPVHHFAYPYGTRKEVGAREYSLGAEYGFRTMTTVREGNIFPDHSRHLECLPRVEITGRHQNLTLVDMRRCGILSLVRNGFRRVVTV